MVINLFFRCQFLVDMSQFDNKPYRILAVDDELSVLGLYEQILSPQLEIKDASSQQIATPNRPYLNGLAFDVTSCSQGDQAVEAVRVSIKEGSPFAVAFLDLHMPPGPDGNWTAEQIQKLDPGVNIILVTGYSSSELDDFAIKSNYSDQLLYLQKPFHRQEIIQYASTLSTK